MKNRPIKFRAWNRSEERMEDVIVINFANKSIITNFGEYDEDICDLLQSTGLCDNTKWEELTKEEQEAWLRNGKKEWHGKEIYEGCLVELAIDDTGSIYEVVFDNEYPGFYLKCVNSNDDGYVGKLHALFEGRVSRIIGNIYENPELLEQQNDNP